MVVLITGASSGIGYETAVLLARKGHKVYAAARRTALLEPLGALGAVPVQLDVTSAQSRQACVRKVLEAEGRIDVLVNNAGYGYLGPVECVPEEEARRQMDTNLFGMAAMCSLVIPCMRSQGSGRIINMSSAAGQAAVLYGGWYNISKYAVEALSDNLRIELRGFGIDVVKIEPGGIRTPWGSIAANHLEACAGSGAAAGCADVEGAADGGDAAVHGSAAAGGAADGGVAAAGGSAVEGAASGGAETAGGNPYAATAMREASLLRKGYSGNFLTPPSVVARAVCRAATARRPKVRYRPGIGAWFIPIAHTILPSRWWDAFVRLMGKF